MRRTRKESANCAKKISIFNESLLGYTTSCDIFFILLLKNAPFSVLFGVAFSRMYRRSGIAQSSHIWSSFSPGSVHWTHLVQHRQTASLDVWAALSSAYRAQSHPSRVLPPHIDSDEPVQWTKESSAEVILTTSAERTALEPTSQEKKLRPYVPLTNVAHLELKGDYSIEGGLYLEALLHYGAAAKAYQLAYDANHNQLAKIFTKLARAFRLVGKLPSAKMNLERVLKMLHENEAPSVEILVETLMELGLVKEALQEDDAGVLYEDCVAVLNASYELGVSHRTMKIMNKIEWNASLHRSVKATYCSPFDYDRTFALVDDALEHAEKHYERVGNTEEIVRVLNLRTQLLDRKFFNLRDYAGRIRKSGGRSTANRRFVTNGPTSDEILMFSPTVHQPYRDYKMELTSPIEFEHKEVMIGSNRKIIDDGDPLRRIKEKNANKAHRCGLKREYNPEEFVKW